MTVCDLDSKRAQTVAEKFGAETYMNSRKLLKRKDVEAVSVCTWSTNLAIAAVRVLKAEKHVFVEKPMASTLQQAKKIVDLAGEENAT